MRWSAVLNDLRHIAFIMDGNRRWAKQRGLPALNGHKKGADTLVEIAKNVRNYGIKYMTVYAFSTENWQRSETEVAQIMDLLRQYLNDGFDKLKKENARILFIGERNMLAADIVERIEKIEQETANNTDVTLCVALSYGGRQEIVSAAKNIAGLVTAQKISVDDINVDMFAGNLYTAGIPDPDLMIRTGGEMRISNYLLWQLSYSELYFSKTLWPDFDAAELSQIIDDYTKRERRYGKS
ncbi:MAG: di-trans,poly-cis-decaprenylcistransferase [Alphaproteobacteria bacterium]|nr:di-trans,poly-cis-decaprenylcistransferase [Alphaproteobacteria bacterium]